MTDAQINQAGEFVVLFILVTLLSLGALSMLWGWISTRLSTDTASVDATVMSRSAQDEATIAPSALRQTGVQTDQTAQTAPISRDVMLDTLRSLREHGYSREQARALLRGLGAPLDNNLWSAAAPPEPTADDIYVTPIAGRRTRASYYDDPELEYQAPTA